MTSPWQWIYGRAHELRSRYWESRSDRLATPVISIGNLHWGGTGKTPMVAAIAEMLSSGSERVAILSRGYGRRDDRPRIVSRGGGPEVEPDVGGDEPVLLAEQLPGVAIAVAARRVDAARLLDSELDPPSTVYLLDDGFSHLRLRRDVDLLVLPSDDPLGGGLLAPSGRLREPLASARRADAICIVGTSVPTDLATSVGEQLKPHGFEGPIFRCQVVTRPPRLDDGSELPAGSKVVLVTGIARPERVATTARAHGLDVTEHLALPDHHRYPDRTLNTVRDLTRSTGAVAVLTTAKDRVKLHERLELPIAVPAVVAELDPALGPWLRSELAASRRQR